MKNNLPLSVVIDAEHALDESLKVLHDILDPFKQNTDICFLEDVCSRHENTGFSDTFFDEFFQSFLHHNKSLLLTFFPKDNRVPRLTQTFFEGFTNFIFSSQQRREQVEGAEVFILNALKDRRGPPGIHVPFIEKCHELGMNYMGRFHLFLTDEEPFVSRYPASIAVIQKILFDPKRGAVSI